jgi:hypothetical protein
MEVQRVADSPSLSFLGVTLTEPDRRQRLLYKHNQL